MFLIVSLTLLLLISFAYYKKPSEGKAIVSNRPQEVKMSVENSPLLHEEKECVDQIHRFFAKGVQKFPIVETITYTSRVSWLNGRPAWLSDYASKYETSRHFIARSLNGKADYELQKVSPGDQFNILSPNKHITFHLLVDLSRCTLFFSYVDEDTNEEVLVKQYKVSLGKKDPYSPSGSLTPLGTYKLGSKVAVYTPDSITYFENQKRNAVEIFGNRWIPFAEEVENCTDIAKGYGLHGLPLTFNQETGVYEEDISLLGKYESNGCIRLSSEDIKELFAVIITKPTFVEITKEVESDHRIFSKKQ
jgi:hypothetical protein